MSNDQLNACRIVANCIDDFLEGNMEAGDRRLVEEHLLVCNDCRTYVDSYCEALQLTRAAMQPDADDSSVPDGLIDRILGKLK